MWFKQLFYFEIQNFSPNEEQVKNFNNAINKVLKNKEEINNKFKE
jgi:hypothetical protein